jgi:hypothetical protein
MTVHSFEACIAAIFFPYIVCDVRADDLVIPSVDALCYWGTEISQILDI